MKGSNMTMPKNTEVTENMEHVLNELLLHHPVSFVSSVDEDGFPNTKAMLPPRKKEGIQHFYFTTNTSSMRVKQFRANPKASLYFCDPKQFKGMMLKGTMQVLEDVASKEMIWLEGDTLYYPLGVTDPDYCVLHFTADSGRYYHSFSSESFII